MNPMVCYIYEYKGNQRIRNCGFLKIRPSSDDYTIQMHLRSPLIRTGDTWQLFLFHKEGSCCVLFPLLDLSGEQRAMNQLINLPKESIPEQKTLEEMDGLMLRGAADTVFAAPWLNVLLDVDDYRIWEPDSPADLQEISFSDVADNIKPAPSKTGSSTTDDIRADASNSENSTAGSIIADASKAEIAKADSAEPTAQCNLCQDEEPSYTCRKIARSEMSSLPRNCWYLANNSFLLHGYHNYHHLVLVEEDGRIFLGVPGICDRREAQAAQLYGFPHFSDEYIDELDLDENEKNHCQRFGHWFREI